MPDISEPLMFLINLALDAKDEVWFMRLTSPEFANSVPQSFVDELSKLTVRLAKATQENDYKEMIHLYGIMDVLNERYKFPRQYDLTVKELLYKSRGKSFLKHIATYGIGDVEIVLPDEAKKLWREGKPIHVFMTDTRELNTLVDYTFLPDYQRREAERALNWNNICLIGKGDTNHGKFQGFGCST
jgi:hypothetical protein